jgi:hypothetical protein
MDLQTRDARSIAGIEKLRFAPCQLSGGMGATCSRRRPTTPRPLGVLGSGELGYRHPALRCGGSGDALDASGEHLVLRQRSGC